MKKSKHSGKQVFSILDFASAMITLAVLLPSICAAQFPPMKKWDYRYGGTGNETMHSFQKTNSGGFIIGGFTNSPVSGNRSQPLWGGVDFWVVNTYDNGLLKWEKRYGGTGDDVLYEIAATDDGGFVFCGWSSSDTTGDKQSQLVGLIDYWVLRVDSSGNYLWDISVGGIDGEMARAIRQTPDGGFLIAGWCDSDSTGDVSEHSRGLSDYWVIKVDGQGNKLWDKRYGGTDLDILYTMELTSDGGFIFGGTSMSGIGADKSQPSQGISDYWVVKTDSLGVLQWERSYGGLQEEELFSIRQTVDGGYALAGYSFSGVSGDRTQPNWGACDIWLVRTDSLGNKLWDKRYGGSTFDEINRIDITDDNGFLISGDSYSPADGDKTESNVGEEQTWIVKTDSLGNLEWDKTLFTIGHDELGTCFQLSNGCYVSANFTNAGIGSYKSQPNWNNLDATTDLWIISFCDSTTGVSPLLKDPSFALYPNPANSTLTIETGGVTDKEGMIQLFNATGEMVMQIALPQMINKINVDLAAFKAGIYLMQLHTSGKVLSEKLLITHQQN